MLIKKVIASVLTAVCLVCAMPTAKTITNPFLTTVYARDNVSFYAGDFYGEKFYRKKVNIDSLKLPVGLSCVISTSDSSIAGTLTSADENTARLTEFHDHQQWAVDLLQNKKTTLTYKRGLFKRGTLKVEPLPELKFQAVKKSAKVSNGTVTLSVKYKNDTSSDITIEGFDLNWSDLLFEGDKPAKDKRIEKSDWVTKKVTIPAGKTKTVTLKKKMDKKGKLISNDYPSLYFKYNSVYFLSSVQESLVKSADYYGTISFSEFLK